MSSMRLGHPNVSSAIKESVRKYLEGRSGTGRQGVRVELERGTGIEQVPAESYRKEYTQNPGISSVFSTHQGKGTVCTVPLPQH